MPQNIQKIFKGLKNTKPAVELESKILRMIAENRERSEKKKALIFQFGATFSLGVLLGMLLVYGKSFLESDFVSLIKLIFSDTSVISSNIKAFSMALLEALPVAEIFVMLLPVFALFLMLSWYFKFSNNKLNHVT